MYIDINYLKEKFGDMEVIEASDIDNGQSENSTKLNLCIQDATDLVNSMLVLHYIIPIRCSDGHIPNLIKAIVADLARLEYYQNQRTPEVEERAKNAIVFLNDIINGKRELVCEDGIIVPRKKERAYISSIKKPCYKKEGCECGVFIFKGCICCR